MNKSPAPTGEVAFPDNAASIFNGLVRFDTLAPNQATFLVTDNGSWPLLAPGEYAVIDLSDRQPRDGGLFVIQNESMARRRRLVQARTSDDKLGRLLDGKVVSYPEDGRPVAWWVGDLRPMLTESEIAKAKAACAPGYIPIIGTLSDGPYLEANLGNRLVGRVIGYADTDLGNQIAQEAGWENEDEGNAAFNAAEYVDAMYGIGHEPWVFLNWNNELGWGENYQPAEPRNANPTDEDEARFMAARTAFIKSSRAYAMVLAELVGRGLDAGARA